MNNGFSFTLKSSVFSGVGALDSLIENIKNSGYSRPGVVVDKKLVENCDIVSEAVEKIDHQLNGVIYYYDYEFEPSYQLLDRIKGSFIDNNGLPLIDCTVGIGGGSVLDTAKGISILTVNKGDSISYKGFPQNIVNPLPMIAVPSTAGTGSELVYNASFIDEVTNTKMGINYDKFYPEFAILDPRVPMSAPFSVFASSGCDALVHALESFVSTQNNKITRFFSIEAIRKILDNFPKILEGSKNPDDWSEMQWGAYLAMVGLSNTTSGPSGALSYYVGTKYKIPHGIAGGLFIGAITNFNHENGYHDYSLISNEYSQGISSKELEMLSGSIKNRILETLDMAGIGKLHKYGIKEEGFDGFLDFSLKAKAAFDFNPVEINKTNLINILNEIY